MRRLSAASLLRDGRGMAVVEFALVAPVLTLMLFGFGDLAYQGYMHSILVGAVQKAGRDSTIQSAKTSDIDKQVMAVVWALNKTATYASTRKTYSNFTNAGPEDFDDNNGDGTYDPATDCFYDTNNNNKRDIDPGADGQGGASDVTVYTMTIQYAHIFPIWRILNWNQNVSMSASTTLKNQPYSQQTEWNVNKVCPS